MTDFRPMLAAKADPAKISYPVLAQPKLDGIRAAVVNGKLLSRTLKPIPNREIRAALEIEGLDGLDGEIIVGDPTHPDAYRRTVSFVMAPDKTGEPWAFHAFDLHDDPRSYFARAHLLAQMIEEFDHTDLPVFTVTTREIADEDELSAFEADLLAAGHEGVILRDPDGLYKYGRATANQGQLLKVKRFSDSEAVVIGYAEEEHNANERFTNELGRTARSTAKAGLVGKGRLGKLIVRDRYTGVEFGCGSGFSAAERETLWAERETLIGRTVRYRYFAVGVKDRPRHPVFDGFREAADMPEVDEPAMVQE